MPGLGVRVRVRFGVSVGKAANVIRVGSWGLGYEANSTGLCRLASRGSKVEQYGVGVFLHQALPSLESHRVLSIPLCVRPPGSTGQALIKQGLIRAGHDVSAGGLLTSLLEMAIAGDCGLHLHLPPTFRWALDWG